MKLRDFIECLSFSEHCKEIIIVDESLKVVFSEPFSTITVSHLENLKLDEKTIVIIKTGQTYFKILVKDY